MGRKAGFLTAATSLARQHENDGPHLVYPPECTFSLDKFLGQVDAVYKKLGRCLVCVGEGVAEKIPEMKLDEKDSHGNVQLSGSGSFGDFLAGQIKSKLGAKRVRADTYGYLQRSFAGCYSEVDAFEARRVGEFAVRWAVAENVDGSVAIKRLGDGKDYAVDFVSTPLETVAKNTKSMPAEWLINEQSDISEQFRTYALPLVGELPVARPPGRLPHQEEVAPGAGQNSGGGACVISSTAFLNSSIRSRESGSVAATIDGRPVAKASRRLPSSPSLSPTYL